MTARPDVPEAGAARTSDATRDNIRGSSLLTAGRLIAVAINFVVHIAIVRYLTQAEYGAWAYAISAVALGSSIAVFGMNKTMARFVPIYEEREDFDRVFGALAVGLGIIAVLAGTLVLGFYGLRGTLGDLLIESELALAVLTIMILTVPLQAFDSALLGLFAIFGNARMIFWRRHIIQPLLSLALVGVLVVMAGDVFFLAIASVVIGAVTLVVFVLILVDTLRRQRFFARLDLRTVRFPVREMLGFSLPLLSTDVVFMLRGSLIVIILGSMAGVSQVAVFSAVAPLAAQNSLVLDSFRLLFTPAAARLYARDDANGINDLYWQTAIWVVISTLPILLVSVSLARPVTIFLFGETYAESASVLAILAVGYFVNSAFGHNGYTLRVYGRVRYLVSVDLLTAIAGLLAAIPLIMAWGAVGAAVGAALIFIVQNLLYQVGLARSTSVAGFPRRYLPVYFGIPLSVGVVLAAQATFDLPLWAGVGLAAVVALAFFLVNRRFMRIGDTFPELRRVPILRRIVD